MILEVCVDSVASAINAQLGGADRLELCENLVIGGTTPSLALFEEVRKHVSLPIHVLLRPRFGDFLYSEYEMHVLTRQASLFHEAGADALVIGCLTADGCLDADAIACLQEAGNTTPCNLHRAFDMCRDLDEALETAKQLDISTILTSGGCTSALEGLHVLNRLQQNAGKIELMAGAGINADAILKIKANSDISAFHMSGKQVLKSQMQYRNPRVSMGLPSLSEYEIWQTDASLIRVAKTALSK